MNQEFSRILFKRSEISGVIPTINTGSTLPNDTWLPTDIMIGECFINVVDSRYFFRDNTGIKEFFVSGSTGLNTFTTGVTLFNDTLFFDTNSTLSAYTANIGSVNTDNFVTGGTYNSITEEIDFVGTNSATTFSVDVSGLLDDTNTYVTGGTFSTGTLTLDRNDGNSVVVTGLTSNDNYTTGATLAGNVIQFNRNDLSNAYNVDLTPIVSGSTGNFLPLVNTTPTTVTFNKDLTFSGSGSFTDYKIEFYSPGTDYSQHTFSLSQNAFEISDGINQTKLNHSGNEIKFTNNLQGGGEATIFSIANRRISAGSDLPTFSGITYLSDYSANYTNRSLVDKGYVDGLAFSGGTGTSGTSGTSGISGTSGVNGANGTSGTSGISGTSGVNGANGTSGTSGVDGINGTSGLDGVNGTSGINGTSGVDGTSGISGVDGTSGIDGTSGVNGTSGVDGINGTSGISPGDSFTTGATLLGNIVVFDRNDQVGAYSVDLSSIVVSGSTDTYVTGGTYSAQTLTLQRNDGNNVVVTGFTSGGGDTYWTAGTGSNSVMGVAGGNTVSGDYAISYGNLSTASNFCSGAFGYGNGATAEAAFAFGKLSIANGYSSFTAGRSNVTNGFASVGLGQTARVYGGNSFSVGGTNWIYGQFGFCFGYGARIDSNSQFSFLGGYSTTENFTSKGNYNFGWQHHTIASQSGFDGDYGTILGCFNSTISGNSSDYSAIIASSAVTVDTSRAIVLGLQSYTASTPDMVYVPHLAVTKSFTPSSSGDTTGVVGQMTWDNDYIYVKTNTGWGRVSLDYGF